MVRYFTNAFVYEYMMYCMFYVYVYRSSLYKISRSELNSPNELVFIRHFYIPLFTWQWNTTGPIRSTCIYCHVDLDHSICEEKKSVSGITSEKYSWCVKCQAPAVLISLCLVYTHAQHVIVFFNTINNSILNNSSI